MDNKTVQISFPVLLTLKRVEPPQQVMKYEVLECKAKYIRR